MPSITHHDIELHYETFGDSSHPCVLLIMGLGTQMTAWPLALCDDLVERGYFVVRFDNRDVGLSTRLDQFAAPNVRKVMLLKLLGINAKVPYSLEDMAGDAIAVLDGLDIPQAHIVGASMGGMIAQLVAGLYPERTLTLTSIMSTTGHRSLPRSEASAIAALMMQPDDPNDMASVLERNKRVRRTLQSPGYPMTDEKLHETVANALQRGGYHPDGVARQLGAIVASKHRRKLLKKVKCPALVLHGEDDALVKLACGVDTHKHLRDSELKTFPGMGHDCPEELMPQWAELIDQTAHRAA